MGPLQVLEDTFAAQGFHVLGFFSDDFGTQGGEGGQIDSCNGTYEVSFPEFAIHHVIDVDGAGPEVPQPVWDWILTQPNPNPALALPPDWNFHKYLISRDGKLVQHFPREAWPGDDPNNPNDSFDTSDIVVAIKQELAKPTP